MKSHIYLTIQTNSTAATILSVLFQDLGEDKLKIHGNVYDLPPKI